MAKAPVSKDSAAETEPSPAEPSLADDIAAAAAAVGVAVHEVFAVGKRLHRWVVVTVDGRKLVEGGE